MLPRESQLNRTELPDLVRRLDIEAAKLEGALNPITATVIEKHMRVINSYYSNLIEGNSTKPADIRRAMEGRYSQDPEKRDRQLESLAHIHVQDALTRAPMVIFSSEGLKWIHQQFYSHLPETLWLAQGNAGKTLKVEPGEFRTQQVTVGHHLPPPPDDIERYLSRFFAVYNTDRLPGTMKLIGAMAAHHRLLWIHPFLDGNGRVGRLFTDALLRDIGVGACGVWCLSRGLAKRNADYKNALERADQPRRGDYDGRGALSESSLIDFCQFMLETAIDQVTYLASLIKPYEMSQRIQAYIRDRNNGLIAGVGKIKPEACELIERAFLYGEVARADFLNQATSSKPTARKLLQQMKNEGLIAETSSRSPLYWAIPDHAEKYFFPDLS